MSGWNLPLGVTTAMIPGNRPEDEWWEKLFEEGHRARARGTPKTPINNSLL